MTVRLSLTQFQRLVNTLEPKLHDATVRGLKKAALYFEGRVVLEISQATPRAAVDTGDLRNSVNTTPMADGAIVAVDAPHAGVMEYGRRPGGKKPPLQPLIDWVKRHPQIMKTALAANQGAYKRQMKAAGAVVGMAYARRAAKATGARRESAARSVAFAIQKKIARDGIEPRHYFAKAWARSIDRMVLMVNYEIAKTGWKPTAKARKTLAAMFRQGKKA